MAGEWELLAIVVRRLDAESRAQRLVLRELVGEWARLSADPAQAAKALHDAINALIDDLPLEPEDDARRNERIRQSLTSFFSGVVGSLGEEPGA